MDQRSRGCLGSSEHRRKNLSGSCHESEDRRNHSRSRHGSKDSRSRSCHGPRDSRSWDYQRFFTDRCPGGQHRSPDHRPRDCQESLTALWAVTGRWITRTGPRSHSQYRHQSPSRRSRDHHGSSSHRSRDSHGCLRSRLGSPRRRSRDSYGKENRYRSSDHHQFRWSRSTKDMGLRRTTCRLPSPDNTDSPCQPVDAPCGNHSKLLSEPPTMPLGFRIWRETRCPRRS